MSDITLSKAVRTNLLSLQNTADMMATTQNRLATGKKVNSALDNPTNFFTASGLNSRASDMSALLDSMANGIQTLEAADNGLEAITKNLESMQSTLRQARQDKSFETASYSLSAGLTTTDTISFSGGAVGTTGVDITLGTAAVTATTATLDGAGGTDYTTGTTVVNGGTANQFDGESITITAENGDTVTHTIAAGDDADALTAALGANGFTVTGAANGFDISRTDGSNFTVTSSDANLLADIGFGTTATSTDGVEGAAAAGKTVDTLVNEINNNAALDGKVRASNDNGKLRIENLSTQDLAVDGVTAAGMVDGNTTDAASIGGNEVRAGLSDQYNELRDQLDKLADDASFNGINLLRGDKLKITFNETGTSALDIQTEGGDPVNSKNLGLQLDDDGRLFMNEADLDSDAKIDEFLGMVKDAIGEVRSQASSFGSSLSIVENRQDFTKNMINTLETGAGNLTLADTNEEAANLLALQTRQQLSSTALSMASQADQAVLRLF